MEFKFRLVFCCYVLGYEITLCWTKMKVIGLSIITQVTHKVSEWMLKLTSHAYALTKGFTRIRLPIPCISTVGKDKRKPFQCKYNNRSKR